ncbi:MAG: P-loop ATPase, Sll1717 family [Bacillota bacterium]
MPPQFGFATLRIPHDSTSTNGYIRETEYQKFVSLKQARQLTLSDFTSIWKVAIYLLLAQQIRDKEKQIPQFQSFFKFRKLSAAIDEFYKSAFSPEVVYAINFAEEAAIAAELVAKYAKVGGEDKTSISFSESRFQVNLMYLQKQFEEVFSSLKLPQSHILFIDGIDIRPESIDYDTYIDCIKGLANAVWSINNDFFANIKDSPGRLKVILLIRPDIFNSLGLQNQNSKIRDNSVILNWVTTYSEYKTSPIYLMVDRLLSYQQEEKYPPGTVWGYYFPYDAANLRTHLTSPSSFVTFLRYSLYRPRDIITILSIQKENFIEQNRNPADIFAYKDFTTPMFTRKYSDYLLGEVRDHISFYYDLKDYEVFLKFFQFLNGKNQFTYEEYLKGYKSFTNFLKKNKMEIPAFCGTPDNFLQFLYDLNVLCYIADTYSELFFGWCYRERSPSNIAPKIRTHVRYKIHYGLMKALDLGQQFIIDDSSDWE